MNTQRSGHAAFGLGTRLCGSGADEFLIFQKKGRQSLPKRPFLSASRQIRLLLQSIPVLPVAAELLATNIFLTHA